VIDAHVRAILIPESAGNLYASVGNHIIQYAVRADHVFEKHSCQFQLVDVLPAGEADHHLSQSVDNYANPSVFPCCRLGQVSDEIHGDSFPRSLAWWQ
jgi:hypothetical protein